MPDEIDPNDYDDPDSPPSGYEAVDCPDCALDNLKSRGGTKASVGPMSTLGIGADRFASLCTTCRGRRWVWWRTSSVPPR